MSEKKEEAKDKFDGQIWSGVFNSFKEVSQEKSSEAAIAVWDDEIWIKKQITQQNNALEKLKKGGTISELAQNRDYFLPVFLAALSQTVNQPRILDFGGGLASSYLPLLSMLPKELDFEFVIIENELICRYGNELFKNDSKINFSNQLPVDERFDIIHLGSSMHYIEDWEKLIRDFSKMKPRYLIFADLPAGDIKTFVTKQYYNGRTIPVRFWNVSEFINKVETFGFKLLVKARFQSDYIKAMKSFPEQNQLNYFSQLVFVSL